MFPLESFFISLDIAFKLPTSRETVFCLGLRNLKFVGTLKALANRLKSGQLLKARFWDRIAQLQVLRINDQIFRHLGRSGSHHRRNMITIFRGTVFESSFGCDDK